MWPAISLQGTVFFRSTIDSVGDRVAGRDGGVRLREPSARLERQERLAAVLDALLDTRTRVEAV